MNSVNNCIFCKISKGEKEDQEIIFRDDSLFIINDIRPFASHHYLVVPHDHLKTAKTLTQKHVPVVENMVSTGLRVLKTRIGSESEEIEDVRLGFHWPPVHTIEHLHLHVMYPLSQMSFFGRNILFRPGFLFVTPEWLLERIRNIPDKE